MGNKEEILIENENQNENQELDFVSEELKKSIEKKVAELKESKKAKRIFPIVVEGDEADEKPIYVGYFKQPDFLTFSKYLTISQKQDPSVSLRQLAKDCFLDGDRELVDDDSLFIYGTMPYVSALTQTRRGGLVNFSKSGK